MLIIFDSKHVNQKVNCLVNGNGVILEINTKHTLPVAVQYDNYVEYYTQDGKLDPNSLVPNLSFGCL